MSSRSGFLEGQLSALEKKLSECRKREGKIRERLSETEKESSSSADRKRRLLETRKGMIIVRDEETGAGGDSYTVSVVDEGTNIKLLERCAKIILDLQRAIRLIKETPHLYGVCVDCGRQISRKRLKALPWAQRCLSCQREEDAPK
jgi:RNA polymerase-binding transcription factor DksA